MRFRQLSSTWSTAPTWRLGPSRICSRARWSTPAVSLPAGQPSARRLGGGGGGTRGHGSTVGSPLQACAGANGGLPEPAGAPGRLGRLGLGEGLGLRLLELVV